MNIHKQYVIYTLLNNDDLYITIFYKCWNYNRNIKYLEMENDKNISKFIAKTGY